MARTTSAGSLFQDPLFQRFATDRPVAVMAQVAFRYVLDDDALRQVFQTHAQAQWEDVVPFAALTQLLARVVLSQEPSVHAGIRKIRKKITKMKSMLIRARGYRSRYAPITPEIAPDAPTIGTGLAACRNTCVIAAAIPQSR